MAKAGRKSLFRAALTLAVAAALGSQGLWAQAGAAGKAATEIQYWFAYSGVVQETNEALVKQFNETVGKDQGVHVTASYQGGYPELNQKVQAAAIAGGGPNVFVMEIGATGAFAKNGLLEPLDAYIAKDRVDTSDFQAALMGNCTVGSKVYGLPFMPSTCILYMNTAVLKNAGLDPAGPKTWDELAAYCKAIKEKTGLYGMTIVSNVWFLEALFQEAGTPILSADEKTTSINTKAGKDVVRFFKDLKDSGYIRLLSSAEGSKLSSDIMNQKCGMWFYSTAGLTTFMGMGKTNGFGISTSFMPKRVGYGTSTGGSNLVLAAKGSKAEKDAAWAFVKWMTATEQTAFASARTGYMPSRKSAIASPAMQKLYAAMPQFKVAVDQMAYATKRPMNPGYTEAADAITGALDAVWVSGQDLDKVFAEVQKKVDALLRE